MDNSKEPIQILRDHGLIADSLQTLSSVNNLTFEKPVRIPSNATIMNTEIGAYSYVTRNSELFNVKIGRYCSLGQNVQIGLSSHPTGSLTTSPFPYTNQFSAILKDYQPQMRFEHYPKRTTIEDDVWIGANVIITAHKPITIGRGSIIAAGAIVTKDVPPYTIVGGNPAKRIKDRFDEEQSILLEDTKWWNYDWPNYCMSKTSGQLPFDKPNEFIEWFNATPKDDLSKNLLTGKKSKIYHQNGQIKITSID